MAPPRYRQPVSPREYPVQRMRTQLVRAALWFGAALEAHGKDALAANVDGTVVIVARGAHGAHLADVAKREGIANVEHAPPR